MNPREWEETLEEQQAAIEEAEANEEVDQLEDVDEDDEDEPKKAKPSKKRKRESEPKPKKKKEPKKSGSAESKEKKVGIKKKSGKNGMRSKETIESEDDGAEDAEGEDAPAESSRKSGGASKRAKKDKSGDDGDFRKWDHLPYFPFTTLPCFCCQVYYCHPHPILPSLTKIYAPFRPPSKQPRCYQSQRMET